MTCPTRKWLKKYTRMQFLPSILETQSIYLGYPKDWDDKNDNALFNVYMKKNNIKHDIRVTCLTYGADRYHFWHIYAGRREGVCLWFDYNDLVRDISEDESLEYGEVRYMTPKQLVKYADSSILPYVKRAQYKDEKEFRIISEQHSNTTKLVNCELKFNAKSLRRIYLNSWLTKDEYRVKAEHVKSFFKEKGGFDHVSIKQNKVINSAEWLNAAELNIL